MTKIYVMVGSSGSYDDHQEWNVRAYTDNDQAINAMASQRLKTIEAIKTFNKALKQAHKIGDYTTATYNKLFQQATEHSGDRRLWNNASVSDIEYNIEEIDLV